MIINNQLCSVGRITSKTYIGNSLNTQALPPHFLCVLLQHLLIHTIRVKAVCGIHIKSETFH